MCMYACVFVSYLFIGIRVIVESYSTVVCDFRQILIIKLLQTDVMGRPGRTGGRTLILTRYTHTHLWFHLQSSCTWPPPFRGEHLSEWCPHRVLRPWGRLLWDMACHSIWVCASLTRHKNTDILNILLCSLSRQRSSALFSILSGPQFTDITVLKWLHHPVFLVSIKHLYICGPLVPTEAQLSTQPSTPLVRDCEAQREMLHCRFSSEDRTVQTGPSTDVYRATAKQGRSENTSGVEMWS